MSEIEVKTRSGSATKWQLPLSILWENEASTALPQRLALARVRTAQAARDHLRTLETTFSPVEWEVVGRIHAGYEQTIDHFELHAGGDGGEVDLDAAHHVVERRLRGAACRAEREALTRLRREGEISDHAFRELEWRIDLAESRLS